MDINLIIILFAFSKDNEKEEQILYYLTKSQKHIKLLKILKKILFMKNIIQY